MADNRSTRTALRASLEADDLPLDHALSLLLADETENALRWGAAVLESGPCTPSSLVVTARLLGEMGRTRAAITGLHLALQQASLDGNLPLAMAALGDLRALGADVTASLDGLARAFCEGSARIRDAQTAPLLPQFGEFRPLSPFLAGPALASKAVQIVETVRGAAVAEREGAPEKFAPLPLFSALKEESLHDLLSVFETLTVPAGHPVIREGEEQFAAYIVARGELEVSRRSADETKRPIVLARLGSGAFFGEMALLSQLPGAASVVATRPSILLVAKRAALESVAERHPDVRVELIAHCRRQSVINLGWASVVVAIPPRERAILVERFQSRTFVAGDKLIEAGKSAEGLYLILSGEVVVLGSEAGERVAIATLTAGETVGEVELVLCRSASADAVALRPTVTLFLPRDDFFALVQDHPAILQGLYGIAVRRHTETRLALDAGSPTVGEESLIGDRAVVAERALENQARRPSTAPPHPFRHALPPRAGPDARVRGRARDTMPGVGAVSSLSPMTAAIGSTGPGPIRSSRALGVVGLLAVAAVVVLFSIRDRRPASQAKAPENPAFAPMASTEASPLPAPIEPAAAAPTAATEPAAEPLHVAEPVHASAAAVKATARPAIPKMRPPPIGAPSARSSVAPEPAVDAAPAETSAASAASSASQAVTPAARPADQALSAGEFGGRE